MGDFFGLGSFIDGIFGAASQASANAANIRMTQMTNDANRQLAEYQWEQNIAQWNRENEYNHPTQQMNRLKEAGLNPNLVYGGGATTLSARSPSYQAPKMEAPRVNPVYQGNSFTNAIQQSVALENLQAQTKNLQTQEDFIKAQTQTEYNKAIKELAHAGLLSRDAAIKAIEQNLLEDTYDARRNKIYSESNKAGFDSQIRGYEVPLIYQSYQNAFALNDAQINKIMSSAALDYANRYKTTQEAAFLEKSFQMRLALAMLEAKRANEHMTDANIRKYVKQYYKKGDAEISQMLSTALRNTDENTRGWLKSCFTLFGLFE